MNFSVASFKKFMFDWKGLYQQIQNFEIKGLARAISLVENEVEGYAKFLENENHFKGKIIGITGPPGAGKSTLSDKIIGQFVKANKKVGVLCVDPSSPFNLGAILGDRLRMEEWYLNPEVYIRSLASRGALGGLTPKVIEIVEVMKMANFDYILIETIGVGQSEIDIVGLADITMVVLVPESGDEIQTMKAGLMEIADIFVINKYDRPAADLFYKNLQLKLSPAFSGHKNIHILKTIATQNNGIKELCEVIDTSPTQKNSQHKIWNYVNKTIELIQKNRMKDISKQQLFENIQQELHKQKPFQLYQFVKPYLE